MKKGFTLLELLAVIVVLAIIALIVTPFITKAIDNARAGSALNSAYGLANSAANHYGTELIKNNGTFEEVTYTFSEGNIAKDNINSRDITFKGQRPISGKINISNKGISTLKNDTKKTNLADILNKEINDQILKLNDLYTELEEIKINDVIGNNLNISSTISDATLILSSYYEYLKRLVIKNFKTESLKDTEMYMHKFYDLANNPNHIIIKNINLFDNNKIDEIVYSRCQLLNINISLEDISNNIEKLKKDVEFVMNDYNIQESSISLTDINAICELTKHLS